MRASYNQKKTKNIQKKKRNLDKHFIKPSQNIFDILS